MAHPRTFRETPMKKTALSDVQLLTSAFNFAADAHRDQRRKGPQHEPYVNHVAAVADILSKAGADVNLIAAALLHDTIEDNRKEVSYARLKREFGRDIADLVCEVTNKEGLSKAESKVWELEHSKYITDRAKILKIADKAATLGDLLKNPPDDWTPVRVQNYFTWAKELVDNCRGINKNVEKVFDAAYKRGARKFNIQ